MILWMGCDPGKAGGLAVVSDVGAVATLATEDCTELELYDWAAQWAGVRLAVLEKVHSMPKQGVASSFSFGASYGALRMLLTALRVPWRTVAPQVWQRALECRSGGDKAVTRAAAQRLFPALAFPSKKAADAVSDALLLAAYARRLDVMTQPVAG